MYISEIKHPAATHTHTHTGAIKKMLSSVMQLRLLSSPEWRTSAPLVLMTSENSDSFTQLLRKEILVNCKQLFRHTRLELTKERHQNVFD